MPSSDNLHCAKLSVIRQKGESQSRGYKKTKCAKFSEKTNISYPLICMHMCGLYVCASGGKK